MLLRVAFAVAYPLVVYVGLRAGHVRTLALLLGVLLAVRLVHACRHRDRRTASTVAVPIIAVTVLIAVGGLLNQGSLFLFVPVLMNIALLIAFARTLRRDLSMVEALARLHHRSLAPGASAYCRRVTAVWCGFFAFNIVVIMLLGAFGSLAALAAYTGVGAYVLMALVFTAELTYRSWRFRHYDGATTDVIFRRLFPPGPVA